MVWAYRLYSITSSSSASSPPSAEKRANYSPLSLSALQAGNGVSPKKEGENYTNRTHHTLHAREGDT